MQATSPMPPTEPAPNYDGLPDIGPMLGDIVAAEVEAVLVAHGLIAIDEEDED